MRNSWILILIFLTTSLWAGIEKNNIRKRIDTLKTGSTFSFQENKFSYMVNNNPQWKNSFDHKEVKNSITLGFDKFSDDYVGEYAFRMDLTVVYLAWNPVYNNFQTKTISPVTLTIYHQGQTTYNDKEMFQFEGGHQVHITIDKVYKGTSIGTLQEVTGTFDVLIPNLYLESEISVERYYTFNQSITPVAPSAGALASNQLPVTWPFIEGAEEYELEWTHVDDFANSGLTSDGRDPATISFTKNEGFRFNSSRISTTSTSYKIPVLYERGYLLYRVRGVGRSKEDGYKKNLYTPWSDNLVTYENVDDFLHKTQLLGHEGNLNWQNSISFAEEGKNKASVSYYDGSLRNRQVATKMNSQNEVIVGETIYDQQGRAALQVLPTPTGQPSLNFNKNINKDGSGNEYNRNDFDNSNADCIQPAPSMSTTSGASQYYSPNNPNKTNENKFIPDAQGKPFTQTVFTPDNTGRIKAQSGVGPTHSIGQGHDTRYFYSKPFQNELTRLFGSEVGNAGRYKKNMVIDANGQISVSYLDPQGRVVATALAGSAPSNVESLGAPSNSRIDEIFELNEAGDAYLGDVTSSDNKQKKLSSSILVTDGGVRTFTYDYSNIPFIALCEAEGIFVNPGDAENQNRCYECVMDLKIELKDECGNAYLTTISADATQNSGTIGKAIIDKLKLEGAYQFNCLTPAGSREAADASATETTVGSGPTELKAGTYTISRILSVNEEALELYVEKYMKDNACLLTLPDFIEGSTIDVPVDCYQGCEACYVSLGDFPQYDIQATNGNCNPCMTYEEYQEELQKCAEICNPQSDDCSALKDAMMGDMSPFGQYGAVKGTSSSGSAVTIFDSPESFPLSVYYEDNYLPRKDGWFVSGIIPNWTHPYLKDAAGNIKYYYINENGFEDFLEVNLDDGVYTPEIRDPSKLKTVNGKLYISPQYLTLKEFLDNFKTSWAESLIRYHPEYGYYDYCRQNQASQNFDSKWQYVGDFVSYFKEDKNNDGIPDHESERLGLLRPLGNSSSDAFDPFFNSSQNPFYNNYDRAYMAQKLSSYMSKDGNTYTMKQAAILTTICVNRSLSTTSPPFVSCSGLTCDAFNKNGAVDETEDWTNETWAAYVSYYMGVKKRILEAKMTQHSIQHGYYNGCIGNGNFNPTQDGFRFSLRSRNPFVPGSLRLWDRYANMSHFLGRLWFFYSSQYYAYQQPCNCYNAVLYSDKIKIYVRNSDGLAMGNPSLNDQLCPPADLGTESLGDYDPDFKFDDPNCEATVTNVMETANKMAAFKYYEDCGNCIQVKWLEDLLSGIAESKIYSLSPLPADDVVLNCFSNMTQQEIETNPQPLRNDIIGYSKINDPYIFPAPLAPTPVTGVKVNWKKTSEANGLLNAYIQRDNDNATCTVVMKMNPVQTFKDANGDDHQFTFEWKDVQTVCCMTAIDHSTMGLPDMPKRMFSAYVYVNVVFSSTEHRVEKIRIEGYTSSYDLITCDPPKSCSTLPIGRELMSFWNGLLYSAPDRDDDDLGAITNQFVSSSFLIDNDVTQYATTPTIYEDIVSNFLSTTLRDGNLSSVYWTWEATGTAGNVLTTVLKIKDITAGTEVPFSVTFTMDGATMTNLNITWSNLVQFTNIKPDESSSDPGRNFIAVAKVLTNTGETRYVTINGYSNDIQLGSCKVAIAPQGSVTH